MNKHLTRFKQLGYWDSVSSAFIMNSNIDGSDTLITSATRTVGGGSPEGENFYVAVQYNDRVTDGYDWEIMEATYSFDSPDHTLIRVSTIASSNSDGAVTFTYDGVNKDNLVIYGINSHESFEELLTLDSRLTTLEDKYTNKTLVSAWLTATTGILINTQTVLTGWTEIVDSGADFNATTGVFTALRDGFYRINFHAIFNTHSDQDRLRILVTQGATTLLTFFSPAASTAFTSVFVGGVVELTAGQTVEFEVLNVDKACNVIGGSQSNTHLSIEEILT